jgi:DNA polymerase-4
MEFNEGPSFNLHLDLNSCFATIEQQANPFLRGKPIAVAAFTSPGGCILAASVEAKRLGIKTGMRVKDGREICPKLIVLPPDPWKYRNVHLKLRRLVSEYTNDFSPRSIDEFILNLKDYAALKASPLEVAREIKARIKKEIGDWLTVSAGIAPNRYLAKVAAELHKPDGLDEINKDNFLNIYSELKLTDLTGIKTQNAARLNTMGIYSVLDFYKAPVWRLRAAFHSITGLYWHLRLSGYEIDDVEPGRHSFGNSVALGKNLSTATELSPIVARLTEKMARRLRGAGYKAHGVHLAVVYKDGSWWHKGIGLPTAYFDAKDFYRAAFRLLIAANPQKPVLNVAVSCFGLTRYDNLQLNFFSDLPKQKKLVEAEDIVNEKWGDFTIGSARSFGGGKTVLDRIAFGGVRELEEFTLNS